MNKWLCYLFGHAWRRYQKYDWMKEDIEMGPTISNYIKLYNEKGGFLNDYRRCTRCGHLDKLVLTVCAGDWNHEVWAQMKEVE